MELRLEKADCGAICVSFAARVTELSAEVQAAAYEAGSEGRLFRWQSGWTTFYWAWWIAFSPFVGLFLARISKGSSVCEFIIGCVVAPALVCFAWMTIIGALPFTFLMVLMAISLAKALYRDNLRDKAGS